LTNSTAPRALELRRLRSLTIVVLGIVLGLGVANFVLSALLGASPRLLRREVVYSPGEFDRIGEQIATAERSLANDARTSGSGTYTPPLTIVVGLSTAREDIDAPTVQQAVCGGSRLLNLGSSGGSFSELAYYLRTLDRTQLHPVAVLLAVHPVWMTSRLALPDSAIDMRDAMQRIRRPEDVVGMSRLAAQSLWIHANRDAIHTVLTNDLLRFRWAFTAPFGLSLPALVPTSSDDPWAPRFSYRESHATHEFLDAQMRSWRALGWFDPSAYTATGPEADALTEIATRSARLAPHTIVALMPESSILRASAPSAAEESLRSALSATGFSFPVLDFRKSIPDSLFYDNAHLNATGRSRFSRTLAGSLRRLIACRNDSSAP
jgi:hypothetical protein